VTSLTAAQIVRAICGGMLIGAGAATLLLLNGRIAGVSGILGNLVREAAGDQGWRLAFLLGLLVPAVILGTGMAHLPQHWAVAVVSGLLVGAGTQIGGGCTSGHGVCGIGRLSARSLVAVMVFVAAGMAATYVTRHLLGVAS
jgi:uncharacterized membrane protein YedE/YeeE